MNQRRDSVKVSNLRRTYQGWAKGDRIPLDTKYNRMIEEALGKTAIESDKPTIPMQGYAIVFAPDDLPPALPFPMVPNDEAKRRAALLVSKLHALGWFKDD